MWITYEIELIANVLVSDAIYTESQPSITSLVTSIAQLENVNITDVHQVINSKTTVI